MCTLTMVGNEKIRIDNVWQGILILITFFKLSCFRIQKTTLISSQGLYFAIINFTIFH